MNKANIAFVITTTILTLTFQLTALAQRYADRVHDFSIVSGANVAEAVVSTPDGLPTQFDNLDSENPGFVALEFSGLPIVDKPGNDLIVHLVDWTENENETFELFGSQDGQSFVSIGHSGTPTGQETEMVSVAFDMNNSGLHFLSYVLIANGQLNGSMTEGPDIDAVEAIQSIGDETITFESGYEEQQPITLVSTAKNCVRFSSVPKGNGMRVVEIGEPQVSFSPNDTPANVNTSGEFFLSSTTSPPSNAVASYHFEFARPVGAMSLLMYDYQDGNPNIGDTATLTLFADEAQTMPVGSQTYENIPGLPEGSIAYLSVSDISRPAISASLELSTPDVGNGIDNITLQTILLGDTNQDGGVSLLDVQPFIELLSSNNYQNEADINLDGVVDLLDIQPFVDLLVGPVQVEVDFEETGLVEGDVVANTLWQEYGINFGQSAILVEPGGQNPFGYVYEGKGVPVTDQPRPGEDASRVSISDPLVDGEPFTPGTIRMGFRDPVRSFSMSLIDIDNGETFELRARGANDELLESIFIDESFQGAGDGLAASVGFGSEILAFSVSLIVNPAPNGGSGFAIDNIRFIPDPDCSN